MGIRLRVSVLAAGPVRPVGFVPSNKADVAVGWDAGHVPDRFLKPFHANGNDRFGIEGVCLAQSPNDVVHRLARPAPVMALRAFTDWQNVGGVPSVEYTIQIRPRAPGFLSGPLAADIVVTDGCQIGNTFGVKH